MEKILSKKSLPQWVKKLNSYEVFAPVKNGNKWDFGVIENPEVIDFDYPNTVVSPKKYVFPQREIFFEFDSENYENYKVEENIPEEKMSLFSESDPVMLELLL